jgi:hypothetical protein
MGLSLLAACSEGAGGDPGERPGEPGVVWAECTEAVDCLSREYCVHPPAEPGFCSEPCDPAGDPAGCTAIEDGMPDHACADIGDPSANLCVLRCGDHQVCPAGMRCESVMTNDGAVNMCF